MTTKFKHFLTVISLVVIFGLQASAQAIKVGTVTAPARSSGTHNYFISDNFNDLKQNVYTLYTDSSSGVAYLMINGVKERLKAQENGEHVPVYSNNAYAVVLDFKKTSQQTLTEVSGLGAADEWGYRGVEGSMTISDMSGKSIVKTFIGATKIAARK